MINREYAMAFTEVLYIVDHMRPIDKKKISNRFLKFLEKNSSKLYKPNLDCTKNLKDMKLNQKTVGILAVIYEKYLSDNEEEF